MSCHGVDYTTGQPLTPGLELLLHGLTMAITLPVTLGPQLGVAIMNGYRLMGSAEVIKHTYHVHLWGLRAVSRGSGEGLDVLGRSLMMEARAAGATEISITGAPIGNPAVVRMLGPVADELGLSIEQVGNGVRMIGGVQ